MGASHLLNLLDVQNVETTVNIGSIISIAQPKISIKDSEEYYYLEIPDISESTGAITNIRKLFGNEITSKSLVEFQPGDILFSRINPRKNRIILVPEISTETDAKFVTSGEIYVLHVKENNSYFNSLTKNALVPILRSPSVKDQIVRLGVGSSSSRARVYADDLEGVRIPILPEETLKELANLAGKSSNELWKSSQKYIDNFVKMHNLLNVKEDKNSFRSI